MSALLELEKVSVVYRGPRGGRLVAVDDYSLALAEGETIGLVGESGSGKSTLGRAALRLTPVAAGRVVWRGRDLLTLSRSEMRAARRQMQIVFQDPFGSLNPRHTVGTIIGEPLVIHGLGDAAARRRRVAELIDLVGLPGEAAGRFPHEFSGGQRQRIAIARALSPEPAFLVADEPVSALDVSVQSQIINLIADLRARLGLTMLFISHDLAVIRHVADRIAVMYAGRLVETGPAEHVLARPRHPYTRALISAIPRPGARKAARIVLKGDPPDPENLPPGCVFASRCPRVAERCRAERPVLGGEAHAAACHFPDGA
ncbi:MAG: ABC transporter ATP-binding protein [Methylobacteriaceae bacterium]|nr:ABC transporter ATP-binding protein [Methylobacteriaceae bacterium]